MCPGHGPENRDFHEISTFSWNSKIDGFFDSIHVSWAFSQFWRPCRGRPRLERRVAPSSVFHMTRRAFLSLRVLNICNIATGEIGSEKRSPFLKLQNLLFKLIAPRVRNSYKNQLFFIDSENHIKSSLRTSSKKNFKNDSKNNEILKSIVFFESLENSKTSVKPI